MILDCNLSFGAVNNGQPYKPCDTFEELFSQMDLAGISGGLLRCSYSDTVGVNYGNAFAAKAAAAAGERGLWARAVWALLPPYTNETPAPWELPAKMRENGVGAVYLNPAKHRWVPSRLTLGQTLAVLQARRIPVFLNTAMGVPMDLTYRILADFPLLTAVVGDADCWPNARRLYPLAYEYENVYLDLSYIMDAGGVEDMVSRFGAEKLLFGTAFPQRYMGSMLAVVRAAQVSDTERELIFGGNLKRITEEACLDAE